MYSIYKASTSVQGDRITNCTVTKIIQFEHPTALSRARSAVGVTLNENMYSFWMHDLFNMNKMLSLNKFVQTCHLVRDAVWCSGWMICFVQIEYKISNCSIVQLCWFFPSLILLNIVIELAWMFVLWISGSSALN